MQLCVDVFYYYSSIDGNVSYTEVLPHNIVKVKLFNTQAIGYLSYVLTEEFYPTMHSCILEILMED